MVIASHWGGFTFPGMIERPGSWSGIEIAPRPARGPEANQRMSLAILFKETAKVFNAQLNSTKASWVARASNLFGALTKGFPVNCAIFLAAFLANCGCVFKPV